MHPDESRGHQQTLGSELFRSAAPITRKLYKNAMLAVSLSRLLHLRSRALRSTLMGVRTLMAVAALSAYLGLGYHYGEHALGSQDDHGESACDLCQFITDSPLKHERFSQAVFHTDDTRPFVLPPLRPALKHIAPGAFDARAPPRLSLS